MIGLFELIVWGGVLLLGASWLLTAMVGPWFVARRWGSAATRARCARLVLHAPLWVPALLMGAMLLPSALDLNDHCLSRNLDYHHHLCLLHPPHATGGVMVWLMAGAALALMSWSLFREGSRLLKTTRMTRLLLATSSPSPLGDEVHVLEHETPLAMTIGILRPRIVVSRGLLAGVSPHTLEVILAHERAHIARHDTRWSSLDRLVASWLPRAPRESLLSELLLAREQACDARAASQRSPLLVARALTEVWRLGLSASALGPSMTDAPLEARVRHLLDTPSEGRLTRALPAALLLVPLLLGLGPLHGPMEELLSILMH